MNPSIETLREVALSIEGECLDLKVWCPAIARTMEARVHADVEAYGRLVWIVGEQDLTWGVSMPGRLSDLETL